MDNLIEMFAPLIFIYTIALFFTGLIQVLSFLIRLLMTGKKQEYVEKLTNYGYMISGYFSLMFLYTMIIPERDRFNYFPEEFIFFYLFVIPLPIAYYYFIHISALYNSHQDQIHQTKNEKANLEDKTNIPAKLDLYSIPHKPTSKKKVRMI